MGISWTPDAGGEQQITIPQWLHDLRKRYGDREAIVGMGRRITYDDLMERSGALARGLIAAGVHKGDRVGIDMAPGPDWAIAWAAISRVGAIAVPLSTFARGRELCRLVGYSDLVGILSTPTLLGASNIDRLERALGSLAEQSAPRLLLAEVPQLRFVALAVNGAVSELPRWATDMVTLTKAGDQVGDSILSGIEDSIRPDDPAIMIFTSGTTADPKGVPHTHATVCFRAGYKASVFGLRSDDRCYASHPIFWVGGLTMSFLPALAVGATSVWTERFDADDVLALIESERLTYIAVLVHQVDRLISHPDLERHDVSSVRIGPKGLRSEGELRPLSRTVDGLQMALGMTETLGVYSWGRGAEGQIATLDVLQPGIEVRVIAPDGSTVEGNGQGEICLRGPTITKGYYKRSSESTIDVDGWFHTGDIATVEIGQVRFATRQSAMIKTSGANVAPAEVKSALEALDEVITAYVVPLPDEVRGHVVAAVVVPAVDAEIDPERIRRQLKKDLSTYKVPEVIVAMTEQAIPWTDTGKVRTAELVRVLAKHREDEGARP